MKCLKPSLRENKRYLLIQGRDADWETIENVIIEFVGILGFAEASPKFIKKIAKGTVIAINREAINKIRASFVISEKDINIVQVSGMVNKLG